MVSGAQYKKFLKYNKSVNEIKKCCAKERVICGDGGKNAITIKDYIKQPKKSIFDENIFSEFLQKHSRESLFTAETDIKYEGYVKIENRRVAKIKTLEKISIPYKFKYESLVGLSNESREKLILVQPETLGQASRIGGVRPSDISVLAIHLQSR